MFLLVLLSACAKPATHAEIRFAIAQAPLTLDPRYATDAASERVIRLLYQPLVDFDAHFRAVPALASWQVKTPTWYRFTLSQTGREFHDGSRLTAADVAETYASLLALKDSPHTAEFSNILEVKAVDNDIVDFTLKQSDEDFPAKLIIGILPAKLIAQQHDFSHKPVGSGALKFVDWQRNLKLQRVADAQAIVLEEVKDPTVRVLKLLRGEADLLQGDLPPELVGYLKQQANIKVLENAGTNYSYLGFNLQDPVLKNPLVRRAVALSINREAMIKHAMVGGTRLATAILPPEHWAGNTELQPYAYDPQLAKKLLQQAGIKLPLKLVYKTSTDAQRVRLATVMQAQMREAGIELEIRSLDWGTFFDDVKHGQFQLFGLTWVGIKTPEIYAKAFHSQMMPPAGANRGRLQDVELDQLLDKHDWKSATVRVHELLPYVPLWYEGQFAAVRSDTRGYAPATDGNWDGLVVVTKHY
ncbi:MAG: ABC transporter substrate-binding protein [Methylophilaceae bacterium]